MLNHPAFYDLDVHGVLGIRSTDQGTWEVELETSSTQEELLIPPGAYISKYPVRTACYSFDNLKEAAEFFVDLRYDREIGGDFDEAALVENFHRKT